MKQLYLHMGMPKTGTTSLQHFLQNKREALEKAGIGFYAPSFFDKARYQNANGAFLCDLLRRELRGTFLQLQEENYRKELFCLRDYARRFDRLILSEELFWMLDAKGPRKWERLSQILAEYLGDAFAVRPVIYLRRQDLWAFSWWKEAAYLPNERACGFSESLDCLTESGYMDYDGFLRDLEEVFGQSSLIVRIYDRRLFPEGSIEKDFLASLQIPWQEAFVLPDTIINPSLTADAAQACLLIKQSRQGRVPEKDLLPGNYREAARLFSRMFPEEKPLFPMEEAARKAFLEQFATGNQRISDRYFRGRPLFDAALEPDELWQPDPLRDKENSRLIQKLAQAKSGARLWLFEYLQGKK